jgi:hypothetical protein
MTHSHTWYRLNLVSTSRNELPLAHNELSMETHIPLSSLSHTHMDARMIKRIRVYVNQKKSKQLIYTIRSNDSTGGYEWHSE